MASADVLGITSEPVILKTQVFDNSSSAYSVSISDSVMNTTASSWSTGGFTVGQKINYDITFLGAGGGQHVVKRKA